MEPKEQLRTLLRIQDQALEIRRSREVVESAPSRLEGIEAAFRERNAEYVTVRERFEELEHEQRSRTQELSVLEESRRKFQDALMQVKNQREYAAVLKEIDVVKAQAADHEDRILKAMDEVETLRTDLEARSAHISEEREKVASEMAQVEREVAEARVRIGKLEADRAACEAQLPRELVDGVRRIEDARQGVFLARAEDQICQLCFVRVRPQVYQEIKLAAKIHSCGNCKRILYYEPALRTADPALPGAPGVEAVNGGPV